MSIIIAEDLVSKINLWRSNNRGLKPVIYLGRQELSNLLADTKRGVSTTPDGYYFLNTYKISRVKEYSCLGIGEVNGK